MGNSSSNANTQVKLYPFKEQLKILYHKLCDYGLLSQELFNNHFEGPCDAVKKNLFERFFIDLLSASEVTANLFAERSKVILDAELQSSEEQLNLYFDLIHDANQKLSRSGVSSIFLACCKYNIIVYQESNLSADVGMEDKVINGLADSCMMDKATILKEDFIKWTNENYPTLFLGFQSWLHLKFTGETIKSNVEMLLLPFECQSNNKILTLSLLWLSCSVLPSCYLRLENKFKVNEDEELDNGAAKYTWNLLYESNEHGLSLNRFKNKVMSYKSPTVMFLQLDGGILLLLALDQPWKDSTEKYGGPYCYLMEVYPSMEIIEADSKMIYLKESSRSVSTGLIIGTSSSKPKIKIDTDLSMAELCYKNGANSCDIERIEVWGCGGVEAISCQADMKKWEQKEVEKRKKVKLPGQWDTDKTILEMGGVTVNHNQRGDV